MKPVLLFLLAPLSAALTGYLLLGRVGGLLPVWLTCTVFFLTLYPFQADAERRRVVRAFRGGGPKFWQYALASAVGSLIISLIVLVWLLSTRRH